MPTFTDPSDFGARRIITPRKNVSRFGDGYEQRVAHGINTQPKEWSLDFENRTSAEITPINAFLTARAGVESFDWTDPDGMAGKWVCDSWNQTSVHAGVFSLSCVFRQVYE